MIDKTRRNAGFYRFLEAFTIFGTAFYIWNLPRIWEKSGFLEKMSAVGNVIRSWKSCIFLEFF